MFSKKNLPVVFISSGILLLVGVFLFGLWSKWEQSNMISTYQSEIIQSKENVDDEVAKAHIFNENITKMNSGQGDTLTANSLQDYNNIFAANNGMIGVLSIDKIDLRLPIYHGTEEEELLKGVGHVSDTAFPLDTVGTKSVLTGHNGLPGADMLFTRLDEMKVGEYFEIQIGDVAYKYKITKTIVITPEEAEVYAQQTNFPDQKAEVTLITCTPYGINSHRLLHIGEFVSKGKIEPAEVDTSIPVSIGKETIVIAVLISLGVTTLVVKLKKGRR